MVDASDRILDDVRAKQIRKLLLIIFVVIILILIFYFAGRIINSISF